MTLAHLGFPGAGGALSIASAIPVGHGYGSSTADVVASIRATAAAYDVKLRASSVSRIAVAAEGASDAIAYEDQAVLFAQREGIVVEELGGALPALLVVGFKANGGQPIDTLRLTPARYSSEEIQLFRVLRGLASRAVRLQDPYLLGRAATISAQISQHHLPKQHFNIALDIANRNGACGVQVAHSGSLIGIILDLSEKGAHQKATAIAEAASDIGFKDVEIHRVNEEAGR
ncbi:kinase [Neomesorhizobium albiziae]|uniref:GHMP family kinase ATP-binding protein n=1 Tax=Neomesorhizobium albiziae TaxID=335020 RepID=UPI001FCEA07A|nr:kinase [Mesorhizobium albiziae]